MVGIVVGGCVSAHDFTADEVQEALLRRQNSPGHVLHALGVILPFPAGPAVARPSGPAVAVPVAPAAQSGRRTDAQTMPHAAGRYDDACNTESAKLAAKCSLRSLANAIC